MINATIATIKENHDAMRKKPAISGLAVKYERKMDMMSAMMRKTKLIREFFEKKYQKVFDPKL